MKTKFILSLFIILFLFQTNYAQKRAITLDDLYKVKSVYSPQLSPSNKFIVFVVSENDFKKGKSFSSIYKMNVDGSQIEKLNLSEGNVFNPFWGKEDSVLYFQKVIDGSMQLMKYNFNTKTSVQLTNFSMGINDPVLSNNGNLILFSVEVFPECGADNDCNKTISKSASEGPIQAYLADDLLFRHWDSYSEGKKSNIFLFNIKDSSYTDLTPRNFISPIFMAGGGIGYNFSVDNQFIAYASNHDSDLASSTNADLFLKSVSGNDEVNLTINNKAWDGWPIFSPDGKYLAYRTQKIPGYESDKFRLAIYDLTKKESKIISEEFDNWIVDFKWSPDSKSIYFLAEEETYLPLYKIDINSSKISKIIEKRTISDFKISNDGKFIYYTFRLMDKPAEIYKYDLDKNQETQLTFFNKDLLDSVDFRPAEHLWFKGSDNKMIEVMLIKPHNFHENEKYPLIVNVHGGPQSQWMDAYRGDGQLYSGYGYVVAFPNPHGSTGYGQEFTAAISGDWGGKVYQDIMLVTDSLAKLPFIDTARIGAMGWSYGGYFMNWLQANTNRYKCFVSMMGLFDLPSFWGTTEELWFPEWDLKGQPWNSNLYEKFSPSKYVNNFSTPTLIITGEKDYRVPYTQSINYFTTLQKLGIDSRLIIFKNDGHWPSNVKSMPLYYNAHLEWFHKYLGGKPAPYDSELMVKNRAY